MPWNSQSTGVVAKVEIMDAVFLKNSVVYDMYNPVYWMGFGTLNSYRVPFYMSLYESFYSNHDSRFVVCIRLVKLI